MAEEVTRSAEESGRKPMTTQQMEIIHQTLNFKQPVHRAAATQESEDAYRDQWMERNNYTSAGKGLGVDNVPSLRLGDRSLMYRDLDESRAPEAMWKDVSKSVEALDNVDPMIDSWNMTGNVYDHGNYCEFNLGLYEVEKKHILDFKRMSGDGFVMDGFFRKVIKTLLENNQGLILDEEEDDGDDVFEDYSDDESDGKDSEDNAQLTSYGYLQLCYDENLITSWINKIRTRHVEDKNHMMGLMAYNALHEENLEIIVRKGAKELRDLLTLQLNQSNTAVLVRNTAALAKAVTSHKGSAEHGYDSAFVEAVFNAMEHWVPGNGRRKQQRTSLTFEITESRETADCLVQTLFNIKDLVSEKEMIAQAKKLTTEKSTPIVNYLNEKETTIPISFLLNIFKQASPE